ncbi:hypothetical protein D3C85_800880 [compost metagenome]
MDFRRGHDEIGIAADRRNTSSSDEIREMASSVPGFHWATNCRRGRCVFSREPWLGNRPERPSVPLVRMAHPTALAVPQRPPFGDQVRQLSRYWLGERPVRALNWRLKALWSV